MVAAVVAAAGSGDRLGADSPKALVELLGRPLVAWCLAAIARSRQVERVVIAAPPGFEQQLADVAASAAPELAREVVPGSSSRSGSVAHGLRAAGEAAVIVVHDAARPLVTAELIDRCVSQLEHWRCDATIAAARTTDTIKEADAGGRVSATLERSCLWAVQTPQVFRAEALRGAFANANLERAHDDAELVEAAGGDVRIVEAPRDNLKVTTALDLRIAELLLSSRR
jgi:2-C-methyl-D-erythritol 4-phosphate cytidylyltransferase